MIYIASPYSHKDPNVMHNRYEKVKGFTAACMREGLNVYSPIVHGHAIAESHDLPTDWQFWKDQCLSMLRVADRMIVLQMNGYKESVGVRAEIEFCEMAGIPVSYSAFIDTWSFPE